MSSIRPKKAVEQGQFGSAMEQAMQKKGMDIAATADALGISYEHTRKLVKSLTFPSKLLLEKLCSVLGMEKQSTHKMLLREKLRHKFGNVPLDLTEHHPKYPYIERQLLKLTEAQVNMATAMIDGLVRANKSR